MNVKKKYPEFYLCENLIDWPEQLAILKLSDPQVFIIFNRADSYFISYDEFYKNVAKIQWLSGKAPDQDTIDYILTDCWNFLALHEREEESTMDEMEDEDY